MSHPCLTAILSRGLFLAAHLLKTRARSQVLPPVMPPLTGQGSQQGSGMLPFPRTPVQSWTSPPRSMKGWPSAQPSLLRPCKSGGVNQKARYLQDGGTSDPRSQHSGHHARAWGLAWEHSLVLCAVLFMAPSVLFAPERGQEAFPKLLLCELLCGSLEADTLRVTIMTASF